MAMNNLSWRSDVCLQGRKEIAWGNAPGRPIPIRSSLKGWHKRRTLSACLAVREGASSWGVAPGYFPAASQAASPLSMAS